ncbi:hypothetical protein AC231_00495 [Clostridium pasteurianum]|nr:hypothetical protein AQ983_10970 [Clostridium pasteurianum DSM 525 = ATCC 6013]AOZ79375.1 hypothetical protein AQ984_10965 [Clostridium pasteurianum]ELP60521.1 ABC transporter multidrug-family permease [Clostridium pasteurianum DSM 525 = ATCC 6013]OMH22237.1 hypothetical protein AC231_00495 [Clostridium pasteurianum]
MMVISVFVLYPCFLLMNELIKKLYDISGKECKKITNMMIAEVIKEVFEGIALGAVMISKGFK